MNAFVAQSRAEVLRIFRNPYFIFWSLIMPLIFYVIFTRFVDNGVENQSEWNAHFLMSIAVFSVMGSSIMTLGIRMVQERVQGWSTFMHVTPLSSIHYFLSKMIGQTAVHICSVIIIFLVGALLNGVRLPVTTWLLSGAWIVVASIPFLMLGVLVGTMKRVDTASGISNLIYLGLAITGGLWMPLETMPKMIQYIAHYLPAFHFGNGAWAIVAGDMPNWQNVWILAVYFLLFMLLSKYIRSKQEVVFV